MWVGEKHFWLKEAGPSLLSSSTYLPTTTFTKAAESDPLTQSNWIMRTKPGGHAGNILGYNRDKGRLGKDLLL